MQLFVLNLLLFCLSVTAFGQKTEKLFKRATEFYYEQEYDSALLIYEGIYERGRGDESLIAKAHYNIGHIYMLKKEYKKAKKIFESILNSEYNEMDEGGRGSGIMAEPYSLYKNNSCKSLAEIELHEGNYSKALEYTELFDKVYPYKHFCGNEYASNANYVAFTYARCYEGLGKKDSAISVLLPLCMDNGLADNSRLVKMADSLIKLQYSKTQIKNELDSALKNITNKKRWRGKQVYDYYSTTLFGVEMEIEAFIYNRQAYKDYSQLSEIERYKYNFANSEIYKALVK